MKMPEFTAEASLYKANERYRADASDLPPNSGEVLPQGVLCYLNCIAWGNDPVDCARGCRIIFER